MLTSGLLSSIALVTLTATGVVGFVVGFLACKLLKLEWSAKTGAVDTMVTVAASLGTAFAFAAFAMIHGAFDPGLGVIFFIASAAVVGRHLARFRKLRVSEIRNNENRD